MAKFIVMGNYTAKAFQGFLANPDTDRGAAINAICKAVGAKVLNYDIVRGTYDFVVTVDAPDFESAAAVKLATEASGAVTNLNIMEPININNAAKIRHMSGGQFPCPIVFRGPTASAGQLGATHSQAFDNWFANCPGLKVIVPSNPYDAKGLLKSAIRDDDPVIFMESEQMYGDKGEIPESEYTLPIGVADIKRKGKDVTVVSFGKIIKEAYIAADKLADEGIECEIIDLRTIRPLDYDAIFDSVKKTNRLVILEEAWPFGNISTDISHTVQSKLFDYLDAPPIRVTPPHSSVPYSRPLEALFVPNKDGVVSAALEVLE